MTPARPDPALRDAAMTHGLDTGADPIEETAMDSQPYDVAPELLDELVAEMGEEGWVVRSVRPGPPVEKRQPWFGGLRVVFEREAPAGG